MPNFRYSLSLTSGTETQRVLLYLELIRILQVSCNIAGATKGPAQWRLLYESSQTCQLSARVASQWSTD
jgi:hypothetical protein